MLEIRNNKRKILSERRKEVKMRDHTKMAVFIDQSSLF